MTDNKQIVRDALIYYSQGDTRPYMAKKALKSLENLTDTLTLIEKLDGMKLDPASTVGLDGYNYAIERVIEEIKDGQ